MLGISFALFCLLVAGIPQAIGWYRAHAMSERRVRLDVIKGTALWLPPGSRQEVNAVGGSEISEGGRIRTPADSEALLSFFDGSNIRLWPETTLRILTSRSTTYTANDTRITLAQDQGHARYEVALPATTSRRFELQTPEASVLLREGSYRVEVANGLTTVTVTSGSATVSAGGQAVEALRGEWVKVARGGLPSKPEPSIHNLLSNGDFSAGLEGWQQGNRGLEDTVPGTVTVRNPEGRAAEGFPYVEFSRTGSVKHAETFIHKAVDVDVTDHQMLRLNFQMRILDQTLSGGGILGSEYPLMVHIHYRDSAGNEADWLRGFYIQNTDHHPTPNADLVIRNQWTDVSVNLFDPAVVSPRPAEILWIEFTASGHGYRSDVARVELLAD